MNTSACASSVRTVVIVSCLAFLVTTTSEATTWYVKADPSHSGNGAKNRPFSSLQEAEVASLPGDTILIIQSKDPLDGGIQLKDGQQLIGLGPSVTRANPNSARAVITNTNRLRYDGDAIRLAKNNLVQNIHIDHANRSSI